MRGLCRLTASLLSLVCASTFVLPSSEAVKQLHDALAEEPGHDDPAQLPHDDLKSHVAPIDVAHIHALSNGFSADQDDELDPVSRWLDNLDNHAPKSSGSILTASLFPSPTSLVISSTVEHVTHLPQYSDRASVSVSAPERRLTKAPEPTPLSPSPLNFNLFGSSNQQPLGSWGDTWHVAKLKAQSVVALIASHITDCPSKTKVEATTRPLGTYTSTLSARTVEVTPTPSPVSAVVVNQPVQDDNQSSVVADAESSPEPSPDSADPQEAQSSAVVGASPNLHTAQPSSTHSFSSVAAALPTRSAAAYNISLPNSQSQAQNSPEIQSVLPIRSTQFIAAILIPVILTILLSCIIFYLIIRRNPKRRAERLARREERKNQALYRKALCKHKFRTWSQEIWLQPPLNWFGWRSPEDLAEKGYMQPESGPISAPRVSQEIQSFREAHEFVDSLLQAEQGGWSHRDRRRTVLWLFGGRARRQRALSNASSDLSDSEKLAPPPYEERENYEKIEAYGQSRAGREDAQYSDKSSVSSVIPTSSRHSTHTYSTGDPDSDKE